eukprot:6086123-Ditylum_brightwellii.AAC.1
MTESHCRESNVGVSQHQQHVSIDTCPTYPKSIRLLHAKVTSKCKKGGNTTSEKDIGLAIGGYKSDFLADLVASYLFKMMAEHFTNAIICGVYIDD